MAPHHDDLPPELRGVARALDAGRPIPDQGLLRRVRGRVLASAGAGSIATSTSGGRPVRSRLTITATLVGGLLLSGGGAALGVSALTTSPSASVAQYGVTTTATSGTTTPGAIVSQGVPSGTTTTPTAAPPVVGGVDSIAEDSEPTISPTAEGSEPAVAVQAPRQLAAAADEDELPFTGYAAIPILLIGLALLATGLVLRRRSPAGTAQI